MTSYQFAIIRFCYSAATQEFINIGVVMWVPSRRVLATRFTTGAQRAAAVFPTLNRLAFRASVRELQSRFDSVAANLCEAQVDLEEKDPESLESILRTALRSGGTMFQWSPTMNGRIRDPELRLQKLHEEYVERFVAGHVRRPHKQRRDVEAAIARNLRRSGLYRRLRQNEAVEGKHWTHLFHSSWKNGALNVLAPISFDSTDPDEIKRKSLIWAGHLEDLDERDDLHVVPVVAPPSSRDRAVRSAFRTISDFFRDHRLVRRVITDERFNRFLPEIEADLREHEDDERKLEREG